MGVGRVDMTYVEGEEGDWAIINFMMQWGKSYEL